MLKFIVVAPPYQIRSGGVMVLHELCDALNKNGFPCGILFLHNGNASEQNFQFATSNSEELHMPNGERIDLSNQNEIQEILSSGAVIYPDLITGNPLGARNVIRYILNFNENKFPGDYILSYSKVYSEYSQYTLFKSFKNPAFNEINAKPWYERTLNLTYLGKGPSFIDCKLIKDTILLERDWPRDKNQLALLLKQCKFMFTWDCVTATMQDAMMCGVIPVMLHDKQIPRDVINQMEIGRYPTIKFNSIDDLPAGIEYDIDEINSELSHFKANYNSLSDSWNSRVGQFAASYLNYYSNKIL